MKKKYKLKRKYFILLCIICSLFVINIAYSFLFVYHIKLNGEDNIIIDVNEKYVDKGLSVRYRGKKYNKYKMHNNINLKEPGNYEVEYLVNKKKIIRHVKVKDITPPVINLTNLDTISINYKSKYKEPGFSAIDNYDGDITDSVIISNNIDSSKLGKYNVTYKIKDSFNNETIKKRIVNVVDNEAPVISFNNPYYGYGILNKKVKLNDYKAFDNYDGDITNKVTIENNINNKKTGIYEVIYKVKDSSKNETIIKRKINIQKKNIKGIPVLMYHWFYDDTKNEKLTNINVHNYTSKTDLINQLEFLKKNKYYYPSWEELIDYIDGKIDLPEKSIIITDDDCVNSFFRVALPLFRKYEIPVTSFCITKKTNWQKHVGKSFLDFESHTDNLHERICSNMNWNGAVMCKDYETINKDIKTSINKIKNTYAFAYPFGHYNKNTINALKANKIKLAFTINEGRVKRGSNKYLLPRVRISKGISIKSYAEKVE